MSLTPYGKRVLVEPAQAESKQGAIYLSDPKRPLKGRVIDVGSVTGLTAGDVVHYAAFSGTEIEKDGKKFLVISEDDVLATE